MFFNGPCCIFIGVYHVQYFKALFVGLGEFFSAFFFGGHFVNVLYLTTARAKVCNRVKSRFI